VGRLGTLFTYSFCFSFQSTASFPFCGGLELCRLVPSRFSLVPSRLKLVLQRRGRRSCFRVQRGFTLGGCFELRGCLGFGRRGGCLLRGKNCSVERRLLLRLHLSSQGSKTFRTRRS
jgi:hypothetical protein